MTAPVLVCSPVRYFPDDIATACESCGAAVVHRPHVPAGAVCLCPDCAGAWLAAEAAAGTPAVMTVTPDTARELALLEADPTGGIH